MDNQEQSAMDQISKTKWTSVSPMVEKAWADIFSSADKIVKVHLKFGFEKFADNVSPSLEDILLSLKVVESVLDALQHTLDYSEQRLAINAKQQILWIQGLAEALRNNDQPRYDEAIEKMTKQPVI